jgi:hypothetical protein
MIETLQTLVQAAREQKLPFLLVGGNAVILFGVSRMTMDIDFLITDVHRESWQTLMESHGYRLFHRAPAFDQYEPRVKGGSFPGVDFMLVDPEVWRKLEASAYTTELVPGVPVPLPSPLHLIAMKLQAARNPHRKRGALDYQDISGLLEAQKLDLNDATVEAAILRHGGPSALDRLKQLQ